MNTIGRTVHFAPALFAIALVAAPLAGGLRSPAEAATLNVAGSGVAENAVFGTRDKGFTVTGSSPFSVALYAVAPGGKVESNVASGTLDGFASEGLRVTFTGNTATGVRHGFGVSKGRNVLVDNVATGNVNGFLLHGANEIRDNVASGNAQAGFRLLEAAGSTVTGNLAVTTPVDPVAAKPFPISR